MEEEKYTLYLIQRGTFLDPSKRKSDRLFRDLISFDYMGSAEFEFGSLGRSINRIGRAYTDERVKHITSDIKNINGIPLQLIYIDHYQNSDSENVNTKPLLPSILPKH